MLCLRRKEPRGSNATNQQANKQVFSRNSLAVTADLSHQDWTRSSGRAFYVLTSRHFVFAPANAKWYYI